jgi:hypothetical protein
VSKKLAAKPSMTTTIPGLAKGLYKFVAVLKSKDGKQIGTASGPWIGVGQPGAGL